MLSAQTMKASLWSIKKASVCQKMEDPGSDADRDTHTPLLWK